MTEEMMIELAKSGRPEALEQIYVRNRERIFRLALRYIHTSEDAEDIVQDTFIKALTGINTFDFSLGSSLPAWLSRICVNCAIDWLRNRKRHGGIMPSLDALSREIPSGGPSSEQLAIERRCSLWVQNAVSLFSPRQQTIFTMRYLEHLNIRQIAERMDCSEANIRAHLFRSLSKLRNAFRSES